jgi:hypothetical protein
MTVSDICLAVRNEVSFLLRISPNLRLHEVAVSPEAFDVLLEKTTRSNGIRILNIETEAGALGVRPLSELRDLQVKLREAAC